MRLVVDPSTSTRQVNVDGAVGERAVIGSYPSIMDVSFFRFHQLCTRDRGGRITARDDAGSVVVIKLPALP